MNRDITGAGERIIYAFGPVKREAGERPARSRRCERRALLPPFGYTAYVTGNFSGKTKRGDDAQVRRPA